MIAIDRCSDCFLELLEYSDINALITIQNHKGETLCDITDSGQLQNFLTGNSFERYLSTTSRLLLFELKKRIEQKEKKRK